ncbi:COPI associated protein-domain-containing protein [Absidia repens]|uniref:COPI associated protein-domain-containing protein n=1 Tax=Absidia repens TaxID=90262 RepID=A0A1X2J1S0_9FUNG|nr:COPI associated protein-domain-containing protein [Absidia repens]
MSYYPHRIQTVAFLSLGIINVLVYVLVFAASITKAIDGKLGEIIQAVYCCSFSIFLVFNELKAFSLSDTYFGFLNVYQGKGLFILLLGCLVMCENAFNIIVTIFGFTIGLGYVILSFIPCVSLPKDICYCYHQYRNQKIDGCSYQQRDVLVKYNAPLRVEPQLTSMVNGYSYSYNNQNEQDHNSRILSLDNNSQPFLFALESPAHHSNRSTMNNIHY